MEASIQHHVTTLLKINSTTWGLNESPPKQNIVLKTFLMTFQADINQTCHFTFGNSDAFQQ